METIPDARKEPLKIQLKPDALERLETKAAEQIRTAEQQATAYILQALGLMPSETVHEELPKVAGNGKVRR